VADIPALAPAAIGPAFGAGAGAADKSSPSTTPGPAVLEPVSGVGIVDPSSAAKSRITVPP